MKSYLADINFWVALILDSHTGHATANEFFETLARDQLYFCRFTQIGFLRMLTNRNVMGAQLLTQSKAWQLYDSLCRDEIKIVHLVAVGAENDEVGNVVVLPVAVDVRDLKHVGNPVAAMRADRIVMGKGSLTVVNPLRFGYRVDPASARAAGRCIRQL